MTAKAAQTVTRVWVLEGVSYEEHSSLIKEIPQKYGQRVGDTDKGESVLVELRCVSSLEMWGNNQALIWDE